jgi:hypothetical protein
MERNKELQRKNEPHFNLCELFVESFNECLLDVVQALHSCFGIAQLVRW